jgi:hypothetical protein
MDITKIKRKNEGIRRKRENEGINRRKDTFIKKAYELGEFDGIDIALIICKHGWYTICRSKDHKAWPPSMAEIVSAALLNSTGANTDLGHDVSSPEEDVARRYREASF